MPNHLHTVQPMVTGSHVSSFSSALLAIFLGFTIIGEILHIGPFFLQSNHRGSHILSSWLVHAGCAFVTGIHPCRTLRAGSFESVRWNACVHKLGLFILSYERVFLWNGIRIHVNSMGKNSLYRKLRGRSNPQRCITQDSEPNTLPTELFRPPSHV